MKRSVVLTLCIILCLALSLGGTIAYLTDTDGDVNVMTLGRVKIQLEEYQRDGQGGLEAYVNDRMIVPVVGDVENDGEYGLPTNSNFHDKVVRVVSDSSNAEAYLRVWIGVPSALLNVGGDKDAVHLLRGDGVTIGGETVSGDLWEFDRTVAATIEGIDYTMFCYDYTETLKPNDVTPPVLAGLYLDKMVDNRDGRYVLRVDGQEYPLGVDLSQGLQIPVLAQAVQAAGFASAESAFESARMNDPALFDEYLELKKPIEKLTEQVAELIDQLAAALNKTPGKYESYEVKLPAETYDLNGTAAAQMNALASEAAMDKGDNGDSRQKDVRLLVENEDAVEIKLGDVELADNIVIVNEGGELIINGE